MGYQTLGKIGAPTTHTTAVPSQKTVQRGEARLELFCDLPKCDLTQALSESHGTNSPGYDPT